MKRIPLEPLGEARWAKLDASVFDALDADAAPTAPARRPRRVAAYAAVGLAFAAAALWFLVIRSPRHDELVLNPSHIETGGASSRLAVGETSIEVGPASSVVASGDDAHGILVVVERGRVDCEVTPRRDRPPFVVQAGDVRVRVVGTHFAVTRDGSAVQVSVAHGAVEVSRGTDIAMLHDGESWPAPPPAPPPPAAPTASEEAAVTPHAAVAPPKPSPPDPQRVYENAAANESSDPDAAMASYRRLAGSGGAWAPAALFASGRLAADRGRNAEAKRALTDYLARYPRGPNAEDARRILARLP